MSWLTEMGQSSGGRPDSDAASSSAGVLDKYLAALVGFDSRQRKANAGVQEQQRIYERNAPAEGVHYAPPAKQQRGSAQHAPEG